MGGNGTYSLSMDMYMCVCIQQAKYVTPHCISRYINSIYTYLQHDDDDYGDVDDDDGVARFLKMYKG